MMLTARDEEVDRVLSLEMGGDDCIVKPYSLRVVSAQLQKSQGRIGRLASKPRQAGERCRMAI